MRVLSLFSGIGGLDLGLEWAGMRTVGQCEIDPACRFWLEQHWPGLQRWSDVREVTGDAVEAACGAVDLVAGGPPCQPASLAGRRQGSADVRWLWPEFLRVVREVGPRWVLAENPLGIASLEPQGLDWVCRELEVAGYEVWPVVVGAEHVGAPHRRHRVWIVARLGLADAVGGDSRREPGGWRRPSRALSSGIGGGRSSVAHSPSGGQRVCRCSRHEGDCGDAHGCGEVGDTTVSRCPGGLAEADRALRDAPRDTEPCGRGACAVLGRWPARPGEPQHEWEEPRLVISDKRNRGGQLLGEASKCGRGEPRPTERCEGHRQRDAQSGLGQPAHGPADYVAGRITSRHRREALKALGNAVVPACAEVLGRAIIAAEAHPPEE